MTIPVDPLLPLGPTARMTPLRIRPPMLPGLALLAILVIGLASSLYALVLKNTELPAGTVSWSGLANGETTAAVSHFLQHANPLEDSLVTFDRVTSYLATGDLGAAVRRGCKNWLFLTDELVLHPARTEQFRAKHVADRRAGRGVSEEPAISGWWSCRCPTSRAWRRPSCAASTGQAAIARRLADFEAQLRQGGIAVVDLLRPMEAAGGELYFRTDTHWNERGTKTAADAIAAALRQAGLAPTQKAEFRVTSEPERERVGDLIRLAGLDHVPYPLRPRGDEGHPTVDRANGRR